MAVQSQRKPLAKRKDAKNDEQQREELHKLCEAPRKHLTLHPPGIGEAKRRFCIEQVRSALLNTHIEALPYLRPKRGATSHFKNMRPKAYIHNGLGS